MFNTIFKKLIYDIIFKFVFLVDHSQINLKALMVKWKKKLLVFKLEKE